MGDQLPQYKHGKYSLYAPARLKERAAIMENDPGILELKGEIGLIDARIGDLLQRVDSGESGEVWRELQSLYRSLTDAQVNKDVEAAGIALRELGNTIRRGHMDYRAWAEVQRMIEQRRRLVESERKRIVDLKLNINVQEAMIYGDALSEAVLKNVHDRSTLQAIAKDFESILEGAHRLPVESD